MSGRLDGKDCVITGAGSGIGRASALPFTRARAAASWTSSASPSVPATTSGRPPGTDSGTSTERSWSHEDGPAGCVVAGGDHDSEPRSRKECACLPACGGR